MENEIEYSDNFNKLEQHSTKFKIILENQTKRINKTPKSFSELKDIIINMFNISEFNITHINNNQKIIVSNEKEYQKLIIENKNKQDIHIIKLYVEKENFNYNFTQLTNNNINVNNENLSRNLDEKLKEMIIQKFSNFENNLNKIIEEFNINNSRIINNSNMKIESIFLTQCDICKIYPIKNSKFICIICENLNLCNQCEIYHNHPVIKFKSSEISTKEEIINLILKCTKNQEILKSSSFSGFSPDDTVSTLPQNKKEIISEIIRKDLSRKDIIEICRILDKHNWELSEKAIEEIK